VALAAAGCSSGDDDDKADADEPHEEATAAPAVPSAGCDGAATDEADLVQATMPIRGVERLFLLSAPAWVEDDDPLPLVVDFHGLAEGATVHANMTQMGPFGAEEGFVTVFPHGTGAPVIWNVSTDPSANADLEFVGALLDRVEEEHCIDTSRVYATGLSNGAMMTSTVACTMADRFAAVAPVAGVTVPEGCAPSRPVPVLSIHGTADPILMFNGGVNTAALAAALNGGDDTASTTTVPVDLDGKGYPEAVRKWAGLDGCATTSTDERVSDEVIRRTYDCPDDMAVEFLIVEGGGHSWPSSEFSRSIADIVGPTTFDIDADAEIWAFLQQFHL
jgi:polyhydroxybutyrate depolymerase